MVVLPCWQQPLQRSTPSQAWSSGPLSGNNACSARRNPRGGPVAVGNYPGEVSTTPPGAGDRLVRIGAIVFFVGALATVVTVAPLFLGTRPLPSIAWSLCMLMGVGFLIAAAGVVRSARAGARNR